jgi:hypothetical protein
MPTAWPPRSAESCQICTEPGRAICSQSPPSHFTGQMPVRPEEVVMRAILREIQRVVFVMLLNAGRPLGERRRDAVALPYARERGHRVQRAAVKPAGVAPASAGRRARLQPSVQLVVRRFACSVSTRYFLCEFMSCSTVPSPGRGASKSSVTQPSYCLSRSTWKNAGKSTPPAPSRL